MKNVILIVVLFTFSLGFCQNKIFDSFFKSSESALILKNVERYGVIDKKTSLITNLNKQDSKIEILNFKVIKNNALAGVLQISIVENRVFNQFISLEKYNLETQTGVIQFMDLESLIETVNVNVENDKIKTYTINDLYNPSPLNAVAMASKKNPMDLNGNGDVSFSECIKVVNQAIDDDGFSSWVCDIPILGWLSCWVSTTIACGIYSAAN